MCVRVRVRVRPRLQEEYLISGSRLQQQHDDAVAQIRASSDVSLAAKQSELDRAHVKILSLTKHLMRQELVADRMAACIASQKSEQVGV